MKVLALFATLAVAVHASVTAEEVVNITVGILEGAFQEENLNHLAACVTDTDIVGYDIYDAVEDFIKGDFESIRQGIYYIGDAIEKVSTGMEDCKEAVEIDIPTLVQMGQIFKNPKELITQIGKDILLNGRTIKKEITASISDYNAQNYEQMGKDIGEALSLVLFGKPHREFDDTLQTLTSN